MSPYITFEIFKHQPGRCEKRQVRPVTHSPIRFAKHIVRRLRRRMRRAAKSVARPDQTLRRETGVDRPAMGGTAK